MDYVVIGGVAFFVSGLTLYSGFGLGTLLMPAFALFFPVPVAVAATAVVHLANNLFKVFLVGRSADLDALIRFAAPAALAALAGAALLHLAADDTALISYSLGGRVHEITSLKLLIAVLIVVFAFLDLVPALSQVSFDRRYLPLGGLLSGFFGGLSGHQGALRSAFLIKAGLSKEAFIGTAVLAAVVVDFARLAAYGATFYRARFGPLPTGLWAHVAVACLAAFAGAYLARRWMRKVTYRRVQLLVGVLLILTGMGLGLGLL